MEARPLLIIADVVRTLVRSERVHAGGDVGPGRAPDAVLVRGGSIAAVGGREELSTLAPDAVRLELPGATLTPGLTDSHIHLIEWALARREVDLSAAPTPAAAAQAVAEAARRVSTGWIRGRGWNANRWGTFPDRVLLDEAVPDRPVALQSHDMHALWVNTRALEAAGIDEDTPDPAGGRIARDAAGRPTGILFENAAALVVQHIPEPGLDDVESAVLDAQAALHRAGITGIHSFPGVHLTRPDPLSLLESLRARGLLRLRVVQHLPLDALDEAIAVGLRSGFGGEWIRIGGIKMFLDGALGSRTAWLRAPYAGSSDHGVNVLPAGDFRDAVRRAAAAGLSTTVHAIGDAAVALALDVLADPAVRPGAVPHRIEHVQLLPLERAADAARAGIVASMQPSHMMTDWRPALQHWGAERCRGAFALRSLLDQGTVLAFGSDAPVEPVDPRLGLFAAVCRQDRDGLPEEGWYPEQRIDIFDSLRAYTAGPAAAAGEHAREGCLVPGARADIVAWDIDPLRAPPRELLDMRCTATIVGGELVWHARGEVLAANEVRHV